MKRFHPLVSAAADLALSSPFPACPVIQRQPAESEITEQPEHVAMDCFEKVSLEVICHILSYLPLRDVLKLEHLGRKFQESVSMHLRVRKSIDFTEGQLYAWLTGHMTDINLGHLLSRCSDLRYIYGFHPLKFSKRRTRGSKQLSIPGVIDALSQVADLQGIEVSNIFLLEAILTYLPHVEVLGTFKNRDRTIPIPPMNRIILPVNPRITSLNLKGVVLPELPRMDFVKHIHLQWVRLNQHPFKDFGAPMLQTFVMANCAGPSNALKYVPLMTGLAAARSLTRLVLIRVPFLGGLIQHLVEDSWRMRGFRGLQAITMGACKHALEVDLGFLAMTCAFGLEELSVQPSLTKDSFFSALNMAQARFPHFDSLSLGFVDSFPEAGKWTNEELVMQGLADITENPAMITDIGMKAAGEVFQFVRRMEIYNCPHLHYPTTWFVQAPRSWCRLKELTLRRCHAIRLADFSRFITMLPVLESLHLEAMFSEPPKGCARVGLSAGTGLGVSSALVSNTSNEPGNNEDGNPDDEEEGANQIPVNNNNDGEPAYQESLDNSRAGANGNAEETDARAGPSNENTQDNPLSRGPEKHKGTNRDDDRDFGNPVELFPNNCPGCSTQSSSKSAHGGEESLGRGTDVCQQTVSSSSSTALQSAEDSQKLGSSGAGNDSPGLTGDVKRPGGVDEPPLDPNCGCVVCKPEGSPVQQLDVYLTKPDGRPLEGQGCGRASFHSHANKPISVSLPQPAPNLPGQNPWASDSNDIWNTYGDASTSKCASSSSLTGTKVATETPLSPLKQQHQHQEEEGDSSNILKSEIQCMHQIDDSDPDKIKAETDMEQDNSDQTQEQVPSQPKQDPMSENMKWEEPATSAVSDRTLETTGNKCQQENCSDVHSAEQRESEQSVNRESPQSDMDVNKEVISEKKDVEESSLLNPTTSCSMFDTEENMIREIKSCNMLSEAESVSNESCKMLSEGESLSNESCKMLIEEERVSNESCKILSEAESISDESCKILREGENKTNEPHKMLIEGESNSNESCKILSEGESKSNESCKILSEGESKSNASCKMLSEGESMSNESCSISNNEDNFSSNSFSISDKESTSNKHSMSDIREIVTSTSHSMPQNGDDTFSKLCSTLNESENISSRPYSMSTEAEGTSSRSSSDLLNKDSSEMETEVNNHIEQDECEISDVKPVCSVLPFSSVLDNGQATHQSPKGVEGQPYEGSYSPKCKRQKLEIPSETDLTPSASSSSGSRRDASCWSKDIVSDISTTADVHQTKELVRTGDVGRRSAVKGKSRYKGKGKGKGKRSEDMKLKDLERCFEMSSENDKPASSHLWQMSQDVTLCTDGLPRDVDVPEMARMGQGSSRELETVNHDEIMSCGHTNNSVEASQHDSKVPCKNLCDIERPGPVPAAALLLQEEENSEPVKKVTISGDTCSTFVFTEPEVEVHNNGQCSFAVENGTLLATNGSPDATDNRSSGGLGNLNMGSSSPRLSSATDHPHLSPIPKAKPCAGSSSEQNGASAKKDGSPKPALSSGGTNTNTYKLYKGKNLKGKKRSFVKHSNGKVSQSCQAVSEEIRETTKKAKENEEMGRATSTRKPYSFSSGGSSISATERVPRSREKEEDESNCDVAGSDGQSSTVSQGSQTSRRWLKRKPNTRDQATSTSDPVIEDDHVQMKDDPVFHHCGIPSYQEELQDPSYENMSLVLTIRSRSLKTLTLHCVGVTDILIQDCPFLTTLQGTSCRVLKKVNINRAPKLARVTFAQCKKLEEKHLVAEVCKQSSNESRSIFIRPMKELHFEDLERLMFKTAGLEYHMCLVRDHSPPSNTLYNRRRVGAWCDMFHRINYDLTMPPCDFPMAKGKRTRQNTSRYPWQRHIYYMQGKNADDSNWDLMTDLPWLRCFSECPNVTGDNLTSADRKEGLYCRKAKGHKWMASSIEMIAQQVAELQESGVGLYHHSVIVYVNTCDMKGTPTPDMYF